MTRSTKLEGADAPDQLAILAAELDLGTGLAASPAALPAFFVGWVLLGLLLTSRVPVAALRRRPLLAVGAALGPLAAVLAVEARRRQREARPIVLAPGTDHGGPLDVLVLIQGAATDAGAVAPTLEAVAADLRSVTLARAVPDHWLAEDGDAVLEEAAAVLVRSRALLPVGGPRLAVLPDVDAPTAAQQFASASGARLVLHASVETSPVRGGCSS